MSTAIRRRMFWKTASGCSWQTPCWRRRPDTKLTNTPAGLSCDEVLDEMGARDNGSPKSLVSLRMD